MYRDLFIIVASHLSNTLFTDTNNIGDAWKMLLDMAAMMPDYDQEAVVSLTKFVDQLPAVLNQVFCCLNYTPRNILFPP